MKIQKPQITTATTDYISPTESSYLQYYMVNIEINTTISFTNLNNMRKQELSKKEITHISDTVVFGQIPLEKPNAGKPVEQMRVCIIMQ